MGPEGGMKILVAEDDPTIRQMMITLLSRCGYICQVVDNGRKAVDAWEREEYDFILMDAQMPVMDGFEATRIIRAKEAIRGGHVTIIALTAHALTKDRQECLEAGMDEYLSKPVDFEKLLSLLSFED